MPGEVSSDSPGAGQDVRSPKVYRTLRLKMTPPPQWSPVYKATGHYVYDGSRLFRHGSRSGPHPAAIRDKEATFTKYSGVPIHGAGHAAPDAASGSDMTENERVHRKLQRLSPYGACLVSVAAMREARGTGSHRPQAGNAPWPPLAPLADPGTCEKSRLDHSTSGSRSATTCKKVVFTEQWVPFIFQTGHPPPLSLVLGRGLSLDPFIY